MEEVAVRRIQSATRENLQHLCKDLQDLKNKFSL